MNNLDGKANNNSWATVRNEINQQIYQEYLQPKSKEFGGNHRPTKEDLKSFMCYENVGSGRCGCSDYKILSNPFGFNHKELALICDDGNLPFGYRVESGLIVVYTD